MLFTLKAKAKEQTADFVKLNTLEKIIPILSSFLLVGISILYRIYMERLAEQRNPKNDI